MTMVPRPQSDPGGNALETRTRRVENAPESRMMSPMRRIDVQGELQDGIEPAPGPVMGPDGAPQFVSGPPVTPARPRLCEAGPCRHYHRLTIQVEAESPRAQRVPVRLPVVPGVVESSPKGSIYQPPATYHTQTSHFCYPDVGIEMPLGSMPVTECNRWFPFVDDMAPVAVERVVPHAHRIARQAFIESLEGAKYREELMAWEQARERELADAQEAERLIAESLALVTDGDKETP